MLTFNMPLSAAVAVLPLIIGFVWYHPKVFGNLWMRETGLQAEQLAKGNMAVIFISTYVLSLLLAMFLHVVVIHQFGYQSLFQNEPGFGTEGSDIMNQIADFMSTNGHRFRTFGHGAFHGLITTVFFILPILGINALFERKSFKYILLHVGYWALCASLMGGIICHWA